MMITALSMLDAALRYAALGLPVIPVHTIENGKCTCGGKPGCAPGKHPRTRHGFKDATTDEKTIRRWWKRWPNANIGIPTGKVSGWAVLDIDPRNGGDDSLAELVTKHGPLPHTVEAITGGGGRHIIFAYPECHVTSRNGLRPGIDLKGDGGYIVVEPSLHLSGRRYAWELSCLPEETALAPMPAGLLDLLREADSGKAWDQAGIETERNRANREDRDTERTERTENTEMIKPFIAAAVNGSMSQCLYVSVLSVVTVNQDVAAEIVKAITATQPQAGGQRHRCLFQFARRLQGIRAIAQQEVGWFRPLVKLWQQQALPVINTKSFDESWMDFVHGFERVQFPGGSESIALIMARADTADPPACAANYDLPVFVRLIKLCRELQRAVGDGPFFLSCHKASEALAIPGVDHNVALKLLNAIRADGIVRVEAKPTTTKATRYRYLHPL